MWLVNRFCGRAIWGLLLCVIRVICPVCLCIVFRTFVMVLKCLWWLWILASRVLCLKMFWLCMVSYLKVWRGCSCARYLSFWNRLELLPVGRYSERNSRDCRCWSKCLCLRILMVLLTVLRMIYLSLMALYTRWPSVGRVVVKFSVDRKIEGLFGDTCYSVADLLREILLLICISEVPLKVWTSWFLRLRLLIVLVRTRIGRAHL